MVVRRLLLLVVLLPGCGFFGLDYLKDGAGNPNLPDDPNHLSKVTAVRVGVSDTCALLSDGSVKCWGDNQYGQLCAAPDVASNATSPRSLSGTFSAMAVSARDVCLRGSSNGIFSCCGDDGFGDLGVGNARSCIAIEPNPTPAPIAQSNIEEISAGLYTMIGRAGGNVYGWGYDDMNQAGIAPASACVSTPMPVDGIADAKSVSMGASHACALRNDGSVACWGSNEGYALQGADPSLMTASPTRVDLGPAGSATSITAGEEATCLTTSSGTAYCWGDDKFGQTGNATTSGVHAVAGVTDVVQIASGGEQSTGAHTCAVTRAGLVFCFGSNESGELGRGTIDPDNTTTHPDPAQVMIDASTPMTNVTYVASSIGRSCALTKDGFVWCWGRNDAGQVGDGTTTTRAFATEVVK